MQSTLTSKGQATIPKEVREHLSVKPGDKVKYFLLPDGRAYMLPVTPISSLRGILKRPGQKPVSIEAMDDGIAAAVADRDARSRAAPVRPRGKSKPRRTR